MQEVKALARLRVRASLSESSLLANSISANISVCWLNYQQDCFKNRYIFVTFMKLTWPRGYKKIMLNSASMKFILLINVKMPTIVGILTLISMIYTTSERLKARNFFICQYFSFYEQLKFHAQLS